jgi:predicted kinase
MGLPGSGKSFFAAQLAALMKATYINSDKERKKLLAVRTYTENEKSFVYDAMLEKMKRLIKKNKNVVLDATFYKNEIRQKFINETEGKYPLFIIEVKASEAIVKERLKKIRPDSDADFEVYKKIKKQWEPVEKDHLILRSTNDNIKAMLEKALNYLQLKK